jgi:N-acetyl-anhydromuramyl-L-alanine amidase AmpD
MMLLIAQAPVIKARWYRVASGRAMRVIVIHDMEAPETVHTARDVAAYFSLGKEAKASAHLCVDNTEVVRCVEDVDVAYAAPGCNADGLQLELAGYGTQSLDAWLDDYGRAMLNLAAECVAGWNVRYGIPLQHLTNAQLLAGERGLIGHHQASEVYHQSDHTDPGPNFPWDYFIDNCNERLSALS